MSEWISVKDRLPRSFQPDPNFNEWHADGAHEYDWVLVLGGEEGKVVWIGRYAGGWELWDDSEYGPFAGDSFGGISKDTIKYWMPLPEAPNE